MGKGTTGDYAKMTDFTRKAHTREEINIIVAEQLKLCIEPICHEIGLAIEALQKRIVALEENTNGLIVEMKEWKKNKGITLQ